VRWEWGYPPQDGSAAAARRDVARALSEAGVSAALFDDVQIVVSELVANAIRHAGTDFELTVQLADDRLRVEVFDADTRPPVFVAADPEATSGRGLVIVAAFAGTWGFETTERQGMTGKTVWDEFRQVGDGASGDGASGDGGRADGGRAGKGRADRD